MSSKKVFDASSVNYLQARLSQLVKATKFNRVSLHTSHCLPYHVLHKSSSYARDSANDPGYGNRDGLQLERWCHLLSQCQLRC